MFTRVAARIRGDESFPVRFADRDQQVGRLP